MKSPDATTDYVSCKLRAQKKRIYSHLSDKNKRLQSQESHIPWKKTAYFKKAMHGRNACWDSAIDYITAVQLAADFKVDGTKHAYIAGCSAIIRQHRAPH